VFVFVLVIVIREINYEKIMGKMFIKMRFRCSERGCNVRSLCFLLVNPYFLLQRENDVEAEWKKHEAEKEKPGWSRRATFGARRC
jgi:hypothetical protein